MGRSVSTSDDLHDDQCDNEDARDMEDIRKSISPTLFALSMDSRRAGQPRLFRKQKTYFIIGCKRTRLHCSESMFDKDIALIGSLGEFDVDRFGLYDANLIQLKAFFQCLPRQNDVLTEKSRQAQF